MAKDNKQKGKNDQYLIDYLTKLQKLNDVEVDIPQASIKDVIKDPRQYALDFIELEFAKTVPKLKRHTEWVLILGKRINDGC